MKGFFEWFLESRRKPARVVQRVGVSKQHAETPRNTEKLYLSSTSTISATSDNRAVKSAVLSWLGCRLRRQPRMAEELDVEALLDESLEVAFHNRFL